MLVKFSIGNYLSFKDVQTLSLVPEPLKELPYNLHIPYLYNYEERLLKSVAIYGHNSYGKSNFIKAFRFLQRLIFSSFTAGQIQNKIELEPFKLNISMRVKPSVFEIIFLIKETKYRYYLSITSDYVVQEELHYAEAKVRENYLFKRNGQNFEISKIWNKEANNRVEQTINFTKPHTLFLSVLLSQDNVPKIDTIAQWFNGNVIVPDNYLDELSKARTIYSDAKYRPLILKFIDFADIGFKSIFDKIENLSKTKNQLELGVLNMWYEKEINDFDLYTQHSVYDENNERVGNIEFELQKNESAGSIKYFIIVCFLSYAIKNSQLIWIDELDARFDSNLLEMLIKCFHNPDLNPINSQLIFTTHNTVLLDRKMRRDQMVIVEKNQRGESSLRRMHSTKNPIRKNQSIEKDYRKGKHGGVSSSIINNPSLFDQND